MTMYAPSDVHSVTIPEPDGCGRPHEASPSWPEDRMTVDCPMCELALAKSPGLGFARTANGVTPTCDERAELERLDKAAAANGARRLANWQLGVDAPQTPPASLAEQILALSPSQKAALKVLLTGDDETDTDAPVKRGPGRPRKDQSA